MKTKFNPADWNKSQSFEEHIFELFDKRETKSEYFKILIRLFGKERITEIWKKYQALKGTPK